MCVSVPVRKLPPPGKSREENLDGISAEKVALRAQAFPIALGDRDPPKFAA
jgi:hypothetical protein